MALLSDLLNGAPRLEACLTDDSAHLMEGTVGSDVAKVQLALLVVDGLCVQPDEERAQRYGPSTAAAVLAFKTKRQIINYRYQTKPDNIVGKMTIAALDQELLRKQALPKPCNQTYCGNDHRISSGSARESSFAPVMLASASVSVVFPTIGVAASGPSPSAVAKARAPSAITAVDKSRWTLGRLISFHQQPVLPVPAGLGAEWDALWKYFGLPKFELPWINNPLPDGALVKDLITYLRVVDKVLEGMANNLKQASTLFLAPLTPWYPDTHAFTLRGKRASEDPPNWPDGVYFNPRFLSDPKGRGVGPLKQTEVIIHECAHFVSNERIQDPVEHKLTSAYGYSGYVLHCAFNRSEPFDDSK